LVTTIFKNNSATYIRPDGIHLAYSENGDFSSSNTASSNIIGCLTRSGTAVNLQLNGYIKGVTTIDMISPANEDSYIKVNNSDNTASTIIEPTGISTLYIRAGAIGDQLDGPGKARVTIHATSSSSIEGKFIKNYINSIIDERFNQSSTDNSDVGTIYNLAKTAVTDTVTASYIKSLSYGTSNETTNLAKFIRANDSFNSTSYYTKQ
jgi:hypothetical protein